MKKTSYFYLVVAMSVVNPALTSGQTNIKKLSPLGVASIESGTFAKVTKQLIAISPFLTGEIAPTFEASDMGGKIWKLSDNTSARSTLLLSINPDAIKLQKDLLPMLAFLLSSQQERLKAENIDALLVAPSGYTLPASLPGTPSNILTSIQKVKIVRATKSIEESLGISKAPITAVLIDQAGFVRQIEPFPLYVGTRERVLDYLKNLQNSPLAFQPGMLAPDFAVPSVSWAQPSGRVLRLSDFRGRKNVLITFFPRCFTGSCTFQLSSLRDQASELAANDIQIIAVSVDPAEGEKGQVAFARKNEFTFPFVPDINRNLCLLYGAAQSRDQMALRMSVFVDKNGIVRWIDKQIEPRTHGADVLERWQKENVTTTTENMPKTPDGP